MPTALMLSVSHGSLPLSNVSLPPWKEVKNRIDGAAPSVYADFGRDKYALANVGPNLLTGNGLQSGLGSWTAVSGTVTASGGVMRVAGDGSGGRAQYTMTGLTVGKVYVLTFNFQAFNGTNIVYAVSSNASSTPTNADMVGSSSSTGAKQLLFVANGTTRNILVAIGNTAVGNWADVSDFVVREITSTLGPNLVRNGNFDAYLSGWTDASTAPATVTQSGGQVVVSSDGTNGARLRQSVATVIGRTYVVDYTGTAPLAIGTTSGGSEILAFVGARPRVFVATATTTWVNMLSTTNGQTLDNVSVREVLVGLGPELVTNSEFDTDLTDWSAATSTAPSTVVWSNGVALWQTDNTNAARFRRSVPTVAGKTYTITVSAASGTGTHGFALGTVQGGIDVLANQTFYGPASFTFVALSNTTWLGFFSALNGRTLDYVSIREVLTNQPVQPVKLNELLSVSSGAKTVIANDNMLKTSPANYPAFDYSTGQRRLLIEGAATNLITRSVALELWTLSSTSVTTGELSADGVNNWRVITDASTSVVGNAATSRSVPADTASYVYSVRLKKDPSATNNMQLVVTFTGGTTQNCRAVFDPRTGAVGATLDCTSGSIDCGSECRIWMVVTNNGTNTSLTNYLMPATGAAGSAGSSQSVTQTGSVTVCHAQLETGTYPSSHILTTGSQATRINDICLFSPLLNLCIPQMAASMAYRANIKAAIASQSIIGLTGWPLIRAGIGTPASLVLDASSTAAYALGNVIPGEVGAAFGWDSGGRNGSVNGAATLQNPVAPDKPMPPFAFGPTSGLTAGSSYAIGALVVWPLKASNSNLQQQARAYA